VAVNKTGPATDAINMDPFAVLPAVSCQVKVAPLISLVASSIASRMQVMVSVLVETEGNIGGKTSTVSIVLQLYGPVVTATYIPGSLTLTLFESVNSRPLKNHAYVTPVSGLVTVNTAIESRQSRSSCMMAVCGNTVLVSTKCDEVRVHPFSPVTCRI
jgi:hypothetical protein